MKKIYTTIALAFLLLGLPLTSNAMPILEVENNQLIGARNVNISGKLFNVQFLDGTCVALFSGCNSASDFAFNTLSAAQAAGAALLNTVFINKLSSPFEPIDRSMLFDDNPFQTNGCEDRFRCIALIPFALTPGNIVLTAGVGNGFDLAPDVVFPTAGAGSTTDSTFDISTVTFARFNEVPEPGTLSLFAIALFGLSWARNKKS